LATASQRLAQGKEGRQDTASTLSADEKFLMDLKQRCSMTDKQWEERQKMRASELAAVAKAIAVLSTDDARELFDRTFNPAAFLQTHLAESRRTRDSAARVLSAAAANSNDPRLANLAVAVRLDAFTRVKKALDDMVQQLLQEADEEVKQKDYCVNGLNENERQTEQKSADKASLEVKIDGLKSNIADLEGAIATLTGEITDLRVQQTKAGEERDETHKDFQVTIQDQRDTQAMLAEALAVLKEVYAKAALVQQHAAPAAAAAETVSTLPPKLEKTASPWRPAGFDNYGKNQAAGGVVAMLEQIITDAKLMEKEAMQDEASAQQAYEAFVQDTNVAIDKKERGIVNKTDDKAKAEQDLTEAKAELDGVGTELESLSADANGLHGNCDFLLKNFEARQAGRAQEVEALRQAKAYLSGMKADA